ncbi:MAG: PilZ domain-containing protein [Desulfosudaceae bacterium]
MTAIKQRRAYPRIRCEVPIVLTTDPASPPHHSATMKNYSDAGLYFESSLELEEGMEILLKADDESVLDPVTAGTWEIRRAEVRWCMAVAVRDELTRFGCGVAYIANGESSTNEDSSLM